MSRTTTVEGKTVIKEAVAPVTEIVWNPLDNTGIVRFQIADIVTDAGTSEVLGVEERTDNSVINIDLAEIFPLTLATPYGDVSGLQVAAYIKVLFDQLYTTRFPAI